MHFRETLGEKRQQAAFREGDVRPVGRNVGFSEIHILIALYVKVSSLPSLLIVVT